MEDIFQDSMYKAFECLALPFTTPFHKKVLAMNILIREWSSFDVYSCDSSSADNIRKSTQSDNTVEKAEFLARMPILFRNTQIINKSLPSKQNLMIKRNNKLRYLTSYIPSFLAKKPKVFSKC